MDRRRDDATPSDLETLRRSFVRMLRAENKAPRTIETYALAVDQLAAHLTRRSDAPARTDDLGRADLHEFFIALEEQGRCARRTFRSGRSPSSRWTRSAPCSQRSRAVGSWGSATPRSSACCSTPGCAARS
ncbi:MAG: phage integrase N-terminal SAM-like domain-containing protein [Pseudonocardia sp.]|nr:phage integrase N-terminal SAM-like domain-containing protein [Pseudonocardia sp.]